MSTTWNDSRFGPGSYEHSSQEDRSAPRMRVAIPGNLRVAGDVTLPTMVRDISLTGFTATAPRPIAAHTFCWLTVPGFDAIQGEVVWWENGMAGAAFARILGQDTLDELVARWPGNTGSGNRSPYA